MHGKKKLVSPLSAVEQKVEGHLEDFAECPYCCDHLDDEKLEGSKERALVMGYTECDRTDLDKPIPAKR
jgi:hypothetical protein